jgi:LysM repeat protein
MYYNPEFFYAENTTAQTPNMSRFSTVYVVRPGDTLLSIANRFNTTVDAIVRANNIANPNLIYPGQRLIIPRMPMQPTPEWPVLRLGSRGIYVVYLQTLLLANGYQVGAIDGIFDLRTLRAVENLQRDRGIPVTGVVDRRTWQALMQESQVPTNGTMIYIVEPGDTLYHIAARYNVSLERLIAVNRLENPNTIYPGMEIIIPLQ